MAVFLLTLMVLSAPYAHAQNCSTPPTNGFIGYWKVDETVGATAADSSGNGINGSYTGGSAAALTRSGMINNAFDGQVSVPYNAIMNTADVTISAWFYPNFDNTVNRIVTRSNEYQMEVRPSTNFTLKKESSSNVPYTFSAPLELRWYHLSASFNDATDTIRYYIDGEYVGSATNTDSFDQATSGGITIGGNGVYNSDGLDDIRIYNRVLSDEEIAEIYQYGLGDEGNMIFNKTQAALEYCNGTDWVMAGTGSYNPNAVHFNGTSDYLQSVSALSGVTDTKRLTTSFWIRYTGTTGSTREYFYTDSIQRGIRGSFFVSGATSIYAYDSTGTAIAQYDFGTALYDQQWHHVLMSFDLSDTNKRHVYLDGAEVTGGWNVYTDALIALGGYGLNVGVRYNNQRFFEGGLGDLWIDFDTYIDLSKADNRRKFISASGMPMYLGADGSIPMGAAPDIFLSGETANWHINKGTGGGFTENGEITYSSSRPADPVNLDPTYDPVSNGLVGWWKLDEIAGTTATDFSGNGYDGTYSGGLVPSASTRTGIINNSVLFNTGATTANYIDIPYSAPLNPPFITISAWIKSYGNNATKNSRIVSKWQVGGADRSYSFFMRNDGTIAFEAVDDAGVNLISPSTFRTTTSYLNDNIWRHVVITYDGSVGKIYVDGNEEISLSVAGALGDSTLGTWIGRDQGSGSHHFDGEIDDVRIYDRALSADEVVTLYNYCSANNKGTMKYDTSYNVMTYCNGVEWVAMGPVGGTPPTSGLVAHWALDETSGTTSADSAGSNNGTMQGGLNGTDSVSGMLNQALNFDGAADVINVPSVAAIDNMGLITISAWIYPIGWGGSGRGQIYYKKNGGSQGGYQVYIDDGNERLYFRSNRPTDGIWKTPVDSIVLNQWQHIAVVYDDSNTSNVPVMYINGVNVTVVVDQAAIGVPTTDAGANLYIGNNSSASEGFDGYMDDYRIYDSLLSSSEISQLYHYGTSQGLGNVDNGCLSPAATEGEMLYNADFNVMQYCNGEEWIGIGQ